MKRRGRASSCEGTVERVSEPYFTRPDQLPEADLANGRRKDEHQGAEELAEVLPQSLLWLVLEPQPVLITGPHGKRMDHLCEYYLQH